MLGSDEAREYRSILSLISRPLGFLHLLKMHDRAPGLTRLQLDHIARSLEPVPYRLGASERILNRRRSRSAGANDLLKPILQCAAVVEKKRIEKKLLGGYRCVGMTAL